MASNELVNNDKSVGKQLTLTDLRNLIFIKLNIQGLYFGIFLMVLSYFYNMAVISYNLTGDNEFRLFDVGGVIIMYYYFKNYGIIHRYIHTDKVFYSLFVFLKYGTFSMIFTSITAIAMGKYTWILQSLLYLFHFWAFFLTSVYVAVLIRKPQNMVKLVYLMLTAAIVCFLIIILQNLGVVPYLWKDEYYRAYKGFLNGTLGPNKVVAGITSLLMFVFCIGIVSEKRFKVNALLCYVCIALAGITLLMSGSRTAYVGLVVFLIYYLVRSTKSFIYNALFIGMGLLIIILIQPEVWDRVVEIYNYRVVNKIKDPEDIKEANVGSLYQDLGAGRDSILVKYLEMLATEFYYIPLGRGMNNRLDTLSSAHNMYLSLIYELGIVGLVLYFRWLLLYLFVRMRHFTRLTITLQGLTIAMLVTLFFGEHLYIYRPLFGLLGLFILVTTLLSAPNYLIESNET